MTRTSCLPLHSPPYHYIKSIHTRQSDVSKLVEHWCLDRFRLDPYLLALPHLAPKLFFGDKLECESFLCLEQFQLRIVPQLPAHHVWKSQHAEAREEEEQCETARLALPCCRKASRSCSCVNFNIPNPGPIQKQERQATCPRSPQASRGWRTCEVVPPTSIT